MGQNTSPATLWSILQRNRDQWQCDRSAGVDGLCLFMEPENVWPLLQGHNTQFQFNVSYSRGLNEELNGTYHEPDDPNLGKIQNEWCGWI